MLCLRNTVAKLDGSMREGLIAPRVFDDQVVREYFCLFALLSACTFSKKVWAICYCRTR